MENASKALIIAGSILLSILIIALGMYIFSTSSSTSNVEILNETEIQTFNAKFEKYKGSQLGSNVEALFSALRSNATTNHKSDEKIPGFKLYGSDGKLVSEAWTGVKASRRTDSELKVYIGYITTALNNTEKSHRYEVGLHYNENGLIDYIGIAYNSLPEKWFE